MREFLIVNGMMRSGTIWLSRLFADSLDCACRIHIRNVLPVFDAAIWHTERPGPFIRRVHYFPHEYHYKNVPQALIVRDVRDTVVSQSTFYKRTMQDAADWLISRWNTFYRNWYDDPRVTVIVRYEDLLADPAGKVHQVLGTLSLPIDDELIAQAVYDHEFSRMENLHKGKYGHAGTYKKAMTPELADYVYSECYEVMELYGYME